jgi:hypothetical protein
MNEAEDMKKERKESSKIVTTNHSEDGDRTFHRNVGNNRYTARYE